MASASVDVDIQVMPSTVNLALIWAAKTLFCNNTRSTDTDNAINRIFFGISMTKSYQKKEPKNKKYIVTDRGTRLKENF